MRIVMDFAETKFGEKGHYMVVNATNINNREDLSKFIHALETIGNEIWPREFTPDAKPGDVFMAENGERIVAP